MNTMTDNRSRLQVAILTAAILLPLPMGAWAEDGGMTGGTDAFTVKRAGGLDSAGADPQAATTGSAPGLGTHSLLAPPGIHGRVTAAAARAGEITADVSAAQTDLTHANASVSAATTAAATAQTAANSGNYYAGQAKARAADAVTRANAAKTTSAAALAVATTAVTTADAANATTLSETPRTASELAITSSAAATATAYESAASQANTDATNILARAHANSAAASANKNAALAARTKSANALATATTADSTATTADTTAVNADIQGQAAYNLSLDTLKYLPRSGLGVERKAGGDKMIIDAEYLALTNQQVVTFSGATSTRNTTTTSPSALTFIAGVFAGNHKLLVKTNSSAAGTNVSAIVDGVTVRTTTTCSGSGTWCSTNLLNIPVKYGSTVRIEFGTGKTIYTNWIALCRNSDAGLAQSDTACSTI